MNTYLITESEMIVMLAKDARNPAAIENGTNEFALRAILEVGPGFEWTVGTTTWRVHESVMNSHLCNRRVKFEDGSVLTCRLMKHTDDRHRDGMTDFVKLDDDTYAVQAYEIVVEEVF